MTSRTASTHTNETLNKRIEVTNCGESLNELMAEQNVRQRTKKLHSMEARSHRPSSLQPGSTNSQIWEDTSSGDTQLVTRKTKRVPATTAYKWWNCQVIHTCKLLSTHPFKQFARRFSGSESAAKLTHYSLKPQRPSDSSRSWLHIVLSGDVHPNPGLTTKYTCPVCARNVTGRGVSYLCNRCLDGYIQSVLVFKMQQSTDELRTGYADPHPLYRTHNR